MGTLYRLDFSSGKSYIGATRGQPKRRLVQHRYEAKRKKRREIYAAWGKYGEPRMVILAVVNDADLEKAERKAVQVYGTRVPDGYNLLDGGDAKPTQNPEVAAMISATQKGRIFSAEHREKLAEAKRGTKRDQETKSTMSGAQRKRRARDGCTPQRWRYP